MRQWTWIPYEAKEGGISYYRSDNPRKRRWQSLPAKPSPFYVPHPPFAMTAYQVGATGDDGVNYSGSYGFLTNQTSVRVGYSGDGNRDACDTFSRFTSFTAEGTVDTAYVQAYAHANGNGSPVLKVRAVDAQNPAAPTSAGEFGALSWTTAGIDWDGTWTIDTWEQSPSLTSVIQELVDSYTLSSTALIIGILNDGASSYNYNTMRQYDYSGNTYGLKLTVEYTVSSTAILRRRRS